MGPFPDAAGLKGAERVEKDLADLKDRVFAYYGHLSLKKTSPALAATEPEVPFPEELALADTLFALHAMPVSGGYLNQPWLLMQILEAAVTARTMCNALEPSK